MIQVSANTNRSMAASLPGGRKPPVKLEIRKMKEDDIPQVLQVENNAFPYHPYGEDVYRAFLNDPKVYPVVGVFCGRIVALGVMEIGRGGPWENSREDLEKSYLNELAVHSDARGQKAGDQLLHHLLSACVATGSIHQCALWVLEESQPARKLYDKFQFQDTGERETKHYAPPAGEKVALHLKVSGLQNPLYRQCLAKIGEALKVLLA